MPQLTIEDWAKKNKKAIAKEFIRRSSYSPSAEPSGIFTAGLPGAGKTEFTVALIEELSVRPVRIDMDEIASEMENYNPRKADLFRGGASIIMSRIYDLVLKNNFDFVFDGTMSSPASLESLKRAVEHGYKVKVYYIHQDPMIAWRFTQAREIVEHRAIGAESFCETYVKLEANLRELCKMSKDVTISLIVKDADNKVGQRHENVQDNIFSLLPEFITEDKLKSDILEA